MALINGCNHIGTPGEKSFGEKNHEKHFDNITKIQNKWNSSKAIQEFHGPMEVSSNSHDFGGSFRMIDKILRARINPMKRFHPDFILSEHEVARLSREIDQYEVRLRKKGFVNPFENIIGVPQDVVSRDPLALEFYENIDRAVAYERNQIAKVKNRGRVVASALMGAYKDIAKAGIFGSNMIKVSSDIARLEQDMRKAPTEGKRASLEAKMKQLMESDDGLIISQFRDLIQTSSSDGSFTKKAAHYHNGVVKAAKVAKEYFKEMGQVLDNSLDTLIDNILLSNGVSSRKDVSYTVNKRLKNQVEKIQYAQKAIRDNDAYYPQYIIEDLASLRKKVDSIYARNITEYDAKKSRIGEKEINDLLPLIEDFGQHKHSKKRLENIDLYYQQDPLSVMRTYGFDVITFNKQQRLKSSYTKFLRKLPKNKKITGDYTQSMSDYLEDIYTVSTRGYADRPKWINDLTYTIGATTAIRTMGLGFTGSVRNLASAGFYYSYFGHKAMKSAKQSLQSKELSDMVDRAEKETGFAFNEAEGARELITQGLLPSEGIKVQDIKFNEATGSFEYKDGSGVGKVLKQGMNWTVDKSLFFHRITENMQRGYMFRRSMALYYDTMINNGNYMKGLERQFGTNRAPKMVEQDAKNFALKAVNSWAYEYAPHAKSKFIRGVPGELDSAGNPIYSGKVAAGAVSSWFNMLMHYPHSLISTQAKMLRGAKESVMVGDWTSPEMMYHYRYGAIYAMVGLLSGIFNVNAYNIYENDTIEKIKGLHETIVDRDDTDKITRGIVGEFLGPLPDDIRYAFEASGLLNGTKSDLYKISFGNLDYSRMTKDKEAESRWYKINTMAGQLHSKILPSISEGRGWDMLRHLFKAYPSETTKEVNKGLRSMIGVPTKGNKMYDPRADNKTKMKNLSNIIQKQKSRTDYENLIEY